MTLPSPAVNILSMNINHSNWNMSPKPRKKRRSQPIIFIPLLILLLITFGISSKLINDPPEFDFIPTATPTVNPEALITEARGYYDSGNLDRAIETYKEALFVDASNSLIYTELGRLQVLTGDYEEAETTLRNALLLNPDNPDTIAYLGWCLALMGDREADAEALFLQLIASNPSHALSHAFYAELLADLDDYEKAGEESRIAMDLAPFTMEVLWARGYVLEFTGNYQDAIDKYNQAIQINPNIADLHIAVGRAYRAYDMYDEAIAAFVQANALNPSDPIPDTYLTQIYITQGEYGKAVQSAAKAAEEDPGNPYRYANLGTAHYRNVDYFDAVDAFELALNGGVVDNTVIVEGLPIDYGTVSTYYQLYMLSLAYSGQCDKAVTVAQALIGQLPTDENAGFNSEFAIEYCEENSGLLFFTPTPDADEAQATQDATDSQQGTPQATSENMDGETQEPEPTATQIIPTNTPEAPTPTSEGARDVINPD